MTDNVEIVFSEEKKPTQYSFNQIKVTKNN